MRLLQQSVHCFKHSSYSYSPTFWRKAIQGCTLFVYNKLSSLVSSFDWKHHWLNIVLCRPIVWSKKQEHWNAMQLFLLRSTLIVNGDIDCYNDLFIIILFQCKFCGKAFASHAAHDSHARRTHGAPFPVTTSTFCSQCRCTFAHARDQKRHVCLTTLTGITPNYL